MTSPIEKAPNNDYSTLMSVSAGPVSNCFLGAAFGGSGVGSGTAASSGDSIAALMASLAAWNEDTGSSLASSSEASEAVAASAFFDFFFLANVLYINNTQNK